MELIRTVLQVTQPLKWPRGDRLPLYLWPAMDPETSDPAELEHLVKQLNDRGIGLIMSWNPDRMQDSLQRALAVAKIQKKLGLRVNVNATRCTYSYCNGDPRTAHIGEDGKPFFDLSFGKNHKIGCPFALDFRKPEMRRRVEQLS